MFLNIKYVILVLESLLLKIGKIYIFTLLCILSFGVFIEVSASGNPYKSTGPYGINCTWYTWDKVKNIKGVSLPAWGNAKTWYNSAKGAGFKVGSEPKEILSLLEILRNMGMLLM